MAERNFSENEHVWVEERLSAYIDNQLAALERAQLERHLRDCPRCQASLASLRWTISLVKQAPAPALPRIFTLPVPTPTLQAPAWGFGLARLATVIATLLLFAVIGVDAISSLGGSGLRSSAPAALQNAAQPTSLARAPEVQDQAKAASPTASTGALFSAPQPTTAAAAATQPAVPAVPPALPPLPASAPTSAPAAAPTALSGLGGGPESAETAASPGAKSAATPLTRAPAAAPRATATVTRAPAAGAVIVATPVPASPTATVPVPTATATPVPPSPTATARPSLTPNAQAYAVPTLAPLPPRQSETPQPIASPVRWTEIGLFFLVVFFATITILSRRK